MKETKAISKPEEPTCTVCHKEFGYPDFTCSGQPGNHQLPSKTYYHPGGKHIQDLRDRRRFSPTLILRPACESFHDGQQEAGSNQLAVTFKDGKYTTSDAQLQYYLDREAEVKSGDAGETMWRSIYLTDQQQANLAKNELAALQSQLRQMKESKDLLEQVKQSVDGR